MVKTKTVRLVCKASCKALTANAPKCFMFRAIIFANQITTKVSGKAEKEAKTQSQEEITLTNTLKREWSWWTDKITAVLLSLDWTRLCTALVWKLQLWYLELWEMRLKSNYVRTTWLDAWGNPCNQLYIFALTSNGN